MWGGPCGERISRTRKPLAGAGARATCPRAGSPGEPQGPGRAPRRRRQPQKTGPPRAWEEKPGKGDSKKKQGRRRWCSSPPRPERSDWSHQGFPCPGSKLPIQCPFSTTHRCDGVSASHCLLWSPTGSWTCRGFLLWGDTGAKRLEEMVSAELGPSGPHQALTCCLHVPWPDSICLTMPPQNLLGPPGSQPLSPLPRPGLGVAIMLDTSQVPTQPAAALKSPVTCWAPLGGLPTKLSRPR